MVAVRQVEGGAVQPALPEARIELQRPAIITDRDLVLPQPRGERAEVVVRLGEPGPRRRAPGNAGELCNDPATTHIYPQNHRQYLRI